MSQQEALLKLKCKDFQNIVKHKWHLYVKLAMKEYWEVLNKLPGLKKLLVRAQDQGEWQSQASPLCQWWECSTTETWSWPPGRSTMNCQKYRIWSKTLRSLASTTWTAWWPRSTAAACKGRQWEARCPWLITRWWCRPSYYTPVHSPLTWPLTRDRDY